MTLASEWTVIASGPGGQYEVTGDAGRVTLELVERDDGGCMQLAVRSVRKNEATA